MVKIVDQALAHFFKRPVVMLMRYSVLATPSVEGTPWRLMRRKSPDEYRDELFSDARLRERLTGLTRIVLPSLTAQTIPLLQDQHRLVIFTAAELPEFHLKALTKAIAPFPWVELVLVPTGEVPAYSDSVMRFLKQIGYRGVLATVRLDDDDALGRRYVETLRVHIARRNIGKAITFPNGYVGIFDHSTGTFSAFYTTRAPFIALGLAAISSFDGERLTPEDRATIFAHGPHHKVGRSKRFVVDHELGSYIRSVYPTQDTGNRRREFEEADRVSSELIASRVGLAVDGVAEGQ